MTKSSIDTSKRMDWMDAVRGIAIILVIITHANPAAAHNGIVMHEIFYNFSAIFQPFRIPLLAFISGFLLEHSIRKGGGRYFDGKIRSVLWPFLVWSIIVTLTLGQEVSFQRIFIETATTLWYLHFLLISYIAFFLLYKSRLSLGVATPLFIIASGFIPSIPWGQYTLLFGVVLCGVLVSRNIKLWEKICRDKSVLAATAIPTVWLGWLSATEGFNQYSSTYVLWILVSFIFITGVIMRLPTRNLLLRVLAFVGRHSLVYYVMHYSLLVLTFSLFIYLGLGDARSSILCIAAITITLSVITSVTILQQRYPVVGLFFQLPSTLRKRKISKNN